MRPPIYYEDDLNYRQFGAVEIVESLCLFLSGTRNILEKVPAGIAFDYGCTFLQDNGILAEEIEGLDPENKYGNAEQHRQFKAHERGIRLAVIVHKQTHYVVDDIRSSDNQLSL